MIRLAEGVYTWGYFNAEKKYNFNGFLLAGAGGGLLVDPPPMSEDDRAYFAALNLWPALLLITNRNHARDAASWLEKRPIPVAMHAEDAAQVELRVDRHLSEGDAVEPGLQIVHLPGKSAGEVGLFWERRGLLLLGDALIAPQGKVRMIPDAKLDDPARLRRSLKKLEPLDFDTLLVADGDPLLGGAKLAVDAFLKTL